MADLYFDSSTGSSTEDECFGRPVYEIHNLIKMDSENVEKSPKSKKHLIKRRTKSGKRKNSKGRTSSTDSGSSVEPNSSTSHEDLVDTGVKKQPDATTTTTIPLAHSAITEVDSTSQHKPLPKINSAPIKEPSSVVHKPVVSDQ